MDCRLRSSPAKAGQDQLHGSPRMFEEAAAGRINPCRGAPTRRRGPVAGAAGRHLASFGQLRCASVRHATASDTGIGSRVAHPLTRRVSYIHDHGQSNHRERRLTGRLTGRERGRLSGRQACEQVFPSVHGFRPVPATRSKGYARPHRRSTSADRGAVSSTFQPEVHPVISPYVRRRRLAMELVRLREEHDYSADKLAKAIGVARQRLSRVENGHVRPDLDEIMRILDVLNVGEKRWEQIMSIAREAQERGWWEKFADEMGPRQGRVSHHYEPASGRVRQGAGGGTCRASPGTSAGPWEESGGVTAGRECPTATS